MDAAGTDQAVQDYVEAIPPRTRLYGWEVGRDAGFAARHPELDSSKGTLRLTHRTADGLADDELRDLLRAVFAP